MKINTTMKNIVINRMKNVDKYWANTGRVLVAILFLTLGVGQMWGVDYYFRHWDANNSTHLVDRGSNIHSSYFILSNSSLTFKISDGDWTNANTWGLNTGSISLNSEYTCISTGNNFSLTPPSNRAYFVRFNSSTHKLLISTFVPSAAAPSEVVAGTNAMFYIQGYEGPNYLGNSSKATISTSYPMNYTGISYVNTAKTNLSTYDYITNNPGSWAGDEATNIKSATGGELITRANAKTAAKTASTTTSVTGDVLSISTTTNSTTGVYGSLPLYIQYYIDGTFVGVTYSSSTASYGSITAGGATARASTFNLSEYTNGTHTLKTVLTDGIIYWVADQDNFTVSHPVFTVTIVGGTESSTEAGPSAKGTATVDLPAGKKFTGWSLGSGVTLADGYALTDATIKFNATKASTVTATFENRAGVKMYFAKPTTLSWGTLYAYAWQSSNASNKNATYPGVELSTTETVNCVTYYVYQYYTEADGIGGAATGQSTWNRVIFGCGSDDKKTGDLTISDGRYYYKTSTGTGNASAITYIWYVKGDMNSWGDTDPLTTNCAANTASGTIDITSGDKGFKIYNALNDQWWRITADNISASLSATTMNNNDGDMTLKAIAGTYTFTVSNTNSTPKLAVTFPTALSIYRSNPNDGTNVGDHQWDTHVGNNFTWGLDLAANTTYEFKINQEGAYYGHDTKITTSFSNRTFATGTGDTKLETKSAGRFNFTWNSSAHQLTLQYPKSVVVTASPASVYSGGSTTLTAYGSELGSGTKSITYDFYKGTTLTDANKVGTVTHSSVSGTDDNATQSVTVNFAGNTTSQVYTVKMTIGGNSWTNTVTVYRKWDIYVHDVDSWNAMYYYVYDNASGDKRENWPGQNYSENKYNGTTTWYIVTLDAEYPHFILDNNAGNKQTWGSGVYKNDITDFPAGSFWYVDYKNTTDGKRYYDLHTITPTNPTVTLSASVANCKDITLTGTVTNCGGDGSFASDMKEVYFEVGGTKNAATTVSTTGGTFTKTLTNATAGTTNTLQAFAENVIGTGSSSELHYTNVTLDRQGGTTGATAVTAVEGIAMPAGASVPGKTGYTFGGYYASEGGSGKQYYNASMGSANNWDQTSKDKTIYAKWTAKTYDVILDVNGGSGANQTVTGTYDAAMPTVQKGGSTPIATRSRTGYNFGGYAANIDGSGTLYYTSALASNHIWDVDVDKTHIYAVWTPKQSALTFDYQTSAAGYGSSGSISAVSATYAAAMPTLSGSMPTAANGYAFMGFYDAADGAGTQYYDGTGASVTNWNKDTEDGTTLYAYYKKAEMTALTFDAAIVAPGTTMGVTPTISPTPTGTTAICWRVLHGNGNPLDDQPTFSSNPSSGEAKVTFPASTTSGTYLVEAILRKGSTCDGDVLDSVTANFQVAGDHVVTVQYKCGDEFIQTSTTATGRPLSWTEITAPDIFGYTFSKWKAGDGITIDGAVDGEKASATINFKATYEGKLTAIYTQKQLIYFKNTLGWSDVYVNFYNDEKWNNPKGSGNKDVTNRNKHMTRIGDSDVWYYDYGYNEGGSSISPSLYVSFTSVSQDNSEYFWATNPGVNVVYPAHYPDGIHTNKSSENGFKAATPMFVPLTGQSAVVLNSVNSGKANYYNAGYWTKYTPGTGYTLEIYNSAGSVLLKSVEFTSEDDLMPMKAVVDLEAGQTYKYQLRRGGTESAGIYYGNASTMTYANHGQSTPWEMINTMSPSFSMCGITTNAAGDYTFHLSYSGNSFTPPRYRLRMAVDYPITGGDYRVIYKDGVQTRYKASAIITKVNNSKDTVSFFIRPGNASKVMKIQQATVNESTGAVTWGDYSTITSCLSGLTKDSVYNICLQMNESGAISVENVEIYTGDFYIRTDCANSKWDNYRSDPDHRMTYSEYSITHGGYSHYYCHWVQTDDRKNIKFCIANDYSPSISDTLTRETASGEWANINSFIDEHGNILRNANVRFMWNQHDNTIKRAYIDGAQGSGSDNYLKMLSSDSKIKDLDGNIKTEVYFQDNENWIYETNIQAKPNAQYKLTSNWGIGTVITQYFKGSEDDTETLITGSGENWYVIRVLYDFKTNRLIAAMLPSGEVDEEREINADVMFIREHQGDIEQLILADEGKISKIETAYGVMRFNKWTINNKDKSTHEPLGAPASIYERSLYWVSFPFRVKLSEVFGFGTYGTHWILQYYDGAARAQYGMWAETGTYWKFIWDRKDFILEPNVGYLLTLETELMGEGSDIWGPNSRSSQVELYFPSYGKMPDITQADVVHNLPSHQCEIDRTSEGLPGGNDYRTTYDRRIVDSHWNVLSVPTYVNTDDVTFASSAWTSTRPKFLYTWNADDNTITATSATGFTFHAMHAYMVQFYGNVTWSAHSGSPYPIVARSTYSEAPKEVEFCLELQQNEKMIDRTYINLSNDENVSAGFAFCEDMTKEFSGNKASIYTFIDGDVVAAGNTLPMSEMTTIVPVGVETKKAGDYTISIPEGTQGIGITLVDEETGVRTNLSALDYTINLPAGTHDNRFYLEISPIKTTPTGWEPTSDSSLKGREVRKVLIDQQMYIIKDGKMYDARGNLCK